MTVAAAKRPNGPNGPNAWGDRRLFLALQLLTILPTSPGISLVDMCRDLEATRSQAFRLMRGLRLAGFDIESSFSPKGVKLYYLPKQRQTLIDRILRQ